MPVDFEALDRARLRYADTQNEAGVVGLPNGFLQGFKVTWDDFKVSVGPGIANVNGTQVAKDESTLIVERMWLATRNQSTHYYIYLNREGNFEVDPTGPSQSTDNDFYSFHPITSSRFVGRLYVDSDGDVVFGTSATKAVPEVVVGASTWLDDADYTCDGTADEVEINAAIAYLNDAFGGGNVILPAGIFAIDTGIFIATGITLRGSGFSTILRKGGTVTRACIEFAGTATDIIIRDLKLDESYDSGANPMIRSTGGSTSERVLFQNLFIDCGGTAGTLEGIVMAGDTSDVQVIDCIVADFVDYGIILGSSGDIVVRDCTLYFSAALTTDPGSSQLAAIQVGGSAETVRIVDNHIRDAEILASANIYMSIIEVLSGGEVVIAGNVIEDCEVYSTSSTGSSAIRIASAKSMVSGNVIRRCHAWDGVSSTQSAKGVWIDDVADCHAVGNRIENADVGIHVDTSASDTLVAANMVLNCGQLIDRGNCESTTAPVLTGSTTDAVTTSNATFARSSAEAYEGAFSYKLTITTGGTEGYVALADNESTTDLQGLLPGVEYTFEAWVMVATADGPAVGEVRLEVRDYKGSWAQSNSSGTPTIDTWTKLTVTRELRSSDPTTNTTGAAVRIRIADTASSGEDIYVDNLRVYPTNSQNEHDNAIDDDGSQTRVS